MLRIRKKFRKSNAILEYGVVLIIVLGAMAGINAFLKRHVQARLKSESDALLSHGQGLEWEASISRTTSSSIVDRDETLGANFDITAHSESSSFTYSPPMPPYIMEHKGSAMHVQDAAMQPPQLNNPQHQEQSDERQIQPRR